MAFPSETSNHRRLYQYLVGVFGGNTFFAPQGLALRYFWLFLLILAVPGCAGLHRQGFRLKDPNTECRDCTHTLYFLYKEEGWSGPIKMAMEGDYSRAERAFLQLQKPDGNPSSATDASEPLPGSAQGDCFLHNNLALLRLLQGDSAEALKKLEMAHRMCREEPDIERNLKILLSRF